MKSKKPFFSRELIYNNLRRFWWIAVLYTLALFLVSPLITLTNGSDVVPRSGYNINFGDIFSGTIIFLFTVPVFIGVMMFRYMQNSKSMVTIHAMPYTRLRLYVNNIISGLILVIIPVLLNAAFLSVIQLGNLGGTYFKEGIVLKYLGISIMTSVTLYIWTVFVGMFTGSSIAQIIFTYILNFLFVGIVTACQLLLSGILYGFVTNEELCLKFLEISPIAQIFFVNNSGFSNDITWQYLLIVNIIICTVLVIAGYFVYKNRNLESAGDVISGKYIKPIFKYGVAVCTMLVGAVYVRELFNINSVNIFIYLLFALIGYVIAEMLLRKSFKILDSYKGFLFFSIVFIIVSAGVKADLFGYESYIPDTIGVECAALSLNPNFDDSTIENPQYGVLYEKNNIENIIKLHEKIVEDKNVNLAESDYTRSIYISYKLIDGRVVKRSYEFAADKYEEMINEIYDSKEYIISTNDIFDYTCDDIYGIRISNAIFGRNEMYVSINDKSEIEEFFEIMKNDVLTTTTSEKEEYRKMYRVEISVESKNKRGITTTFPESYVIVDDVIENSSEKTMELLVETFNINAENVIRFIEEKGYADALRSSDKIKSISLRYDNEVKTISEKDEITKVINSLYLTPEIKYYKYDEVMLELELTNDNTRSVDIDKEQAGEIIKMFE